MIDIYLLNEHDDDYDHYHDGKFDLYNDKEKMKHKYVILYNK